MRINLRKSLIGIFICLFNVFRYSYCQKCYNDNDCLSTMLNSFCDPVLGMK